MAWNWVAFHGSSVFGSAVYPTTRVPPVLAELESSFEPLEHAVASRPAASATARHLLTGEPSAVRSLTISTSGPPRPWPRLPPGAVARSARSGEACAWRRVSEARPTYVKT